LPVPSSAHSLHILTDARVLRNITIGRLRIITSKRVYEFAAEAGQDVEPQAELTVLNDAFWVRLCTMGDLGFAEAYMFGEVTCEDLISTFLVSPPVSTEMG
jgi:cyclopropane-fatty-acyl-phospholipid synthase